MKVIYIYILVILSIVVFSCGPKKGIVTKKKNSKKVEVINKKQETRVSETDIKEIKTAKIPSSIDKYIVTYATIAKDEMRKSKIPASITLAQGILESGSGRGRLAVKANNHFGIKCHGWKGAKIYHDDDKSQECFRKYRKAESSYKDHSEFLTGRKRYAKLFKLKPNDYKAWAKGLRAAGYATDRKYPQKLINLIERYKLYEYDQEVLGGNTPKIVRINSGVYKYVIVNGDTLYSLAKRYNTSVKAIKDLNNMTSNDLALGQEIMIPNK
ncbi:glucosaminidase domain-containing protein [Winogradskyella sp. PG-2]|uniref:glucosaminidase domain-containing protein n=1 Tax=Winogradskyella sp. PG-2 TaxID=754409 RepID=UPI000458792E|nr:glucosaminidase domain-containing protein [Winogradskyella sp. PG-2]BAO74894.1 hemagglutinin [Winogradskyella sp. PG-2]